MSSAKFFGDPSSSEDEVESSGSSESDVDATMEKFASRGPRNGHESDSSDSSVKKRVVMSNKDKMYAEISAVCRRIRSVLSRGEWTEVLTAFNDLSSLASRRARKVLSDPNQGPPKVMLTTLIHLDDALLDLSADEKSQLDKAGSKSFNILRNSVPKFCETFGKELNIVRNNMEFESESGSDYDEDEESDEERNRAGDRKLVLSRWFDIGSDSSMSEGSDISEWDSSSSASSTDEELEYDRSHLIGPDGVIRKTRIRWFESERSDSDDTARNSKAEAQRKVKIFCRKAKECLNRFDWISLRNLFNEFTNETLPSISDVLSQGGYPKSLFSTLLHLEDVMNRDYEDEEWDLSTREAFSYLQDSVAELTQTFRSDIDKIRRESREKLTIVAGDVSLTDEERLRRIRRLVSYARKRRADRQVILSNIYLLVRGIQTLSVEVNVLIELITMQIGTRSETKVMSAGLWMDCYQNVSRLLTILEENPNIFLEASSFSLGTDFTNVSAPTVNLPQFTSGGSTDASSSTANVSIAVETNMDRISRVKSHVVSFVELLDDMFLRSLKLSNPHTNEYLDRLQAEYAVVDALERAFQFVDRGDSKAVLASRLIEHLYFKRTEEHEKFLNKLRTIVEGTSDSQVIDPSATSDSESSSRTRFGGARPGGVGNYLRPQLFDLLDELSRIVFSFGTPHARGRAILCLVYSLALHNHFYEARLLLLSSKVHEKILEVLPRISDSVQEQMEKDNRAHRDSSKIYRQFLYRHLDDLILYHRVLAQLGLAAFRNGLYDDCMLCLRDLMSGRPKELLGQSITQRYDRDFRLPESEMLRERLRLVPFHMHINSDMLESVNLICALLDQVTLMASNSHDPMRKITNQPLKRCLTYYERQLFSGPPENSKDFIFAATEALRLGQWKECLDFISRMQFWSMIPDHVSVQQSLLQPIKRVGLRCYLWTYSSFYANIHISHLAEVFELPPKEVHRIISRMLVVENFAAAWDEPNQLLVFHCSTPSRLQYLCDEMADRVNELVDSNEKLLDGRFSVPRVDSTDDRGGFRRDAFGQRRLRNPRFSRGQGNSNRGFGRNPSGSSQQNSMSNSSGQPYRRSYQQRGQGNMAASDFSNVNNASASSSNRRF